MGDVRWAMTGSGSSWKLSGGRWWFSSVTNVSKKRHVRRATSRRARASVSEIGDVPAPCKGRLAHRATAGDAAQRIRKGVAIGHDPGSIRATMTAAPAVRTTPPAIHRYHSRTADRTWTFDCAAVTHSSSRRRLTRDGPACERWRRSSATPDARASVISSAICSNARASIGADRMPVSSLGDAERVAARCRRAPGGTAGSRRWRRQRRSRSTAAVSGSIQPTSKREERGRRRQRCAAGCRASSSGR